MGRAYSAHGREEKGIRPIWLWWDSQKERDNSGDLDIVATIILRSIFKK
jgi:hypothetical protein